MTIMKNALGNTPGVLLASGLTLNDHRNAIMERTAKTGF